MRIYVLILRTYVGLLHSQSISMSGSLLERREVKKGQSQKPIGDAHATEKNSEETLSMVKSQDKNLRLPSDVCLLERSVPKGTDRTVPQRPRGHRQGQGRERL